MNMLIYTVHLMNESNRKDAMTLEILQAINERDDVTQRLLSKRLGLALGLTNSYLKRCVKKGLVKIQQAPANRYLYYLTPKGFSEKSRLTAKYLSASFDFYRKAGNGYRQLFKVAKENGWGKLIFCGVSELTEIASVRILEFDLVHSGTYQPNADIKEFLGKPVYNSLNDIIDVDAYVLTVFDAPENIYKQLILKTEKERIFAPEFLGL
jgi:DNA-binding MarR family transcriptional regulator